MYHYMITYYLMYKMYMCVVYHLGMNTDVYMNEKSNIYKKIVVIMQVASSISFFTVCIA